MQNFFNQQQQDYYTYWKWGSYLTPEQCDAILKERATLQEEQGRTSNDMMAVNRRPDYRKTHVAWLSPAHWLQGALFNIGRHANAFANWQHKLEYPEMVQLARYDEGCYYRPHQDCGPAEPTPDIRKITVVALLSDPASYEGGNFRLTDMDEHIEMKQGDVIAFPSALVHEVQPVTKGERHTATCWVWGPK